MELPPKDWLEHTYPKMPWKNHSNTSFVEHWYAYSQSFERVLSEWSNGNFSSSRPGFPQPIGSMVRTLKWSQERAEAKQAELIGMTAVVEVDDSIFSRVGSGVKASFETETAAQGALSTAV